MNLATGLYIMLNVHRHKVLQGQCSEILDVLFSEKRSLPPLTIPFSNYLWFTLVIMTPVTCLGRFTGQIRYTLNTRLYIAEWQHNSASDVDYGLEFTHWAKPRTEILEQSKWARNRLLRAGTKTLFLLGSSPPRIVLKFQHRARIRKLFKEPRNRFSAWRASTTTLYDVPALQATKADSRFLGINSWAPKTFTNSGSGV